MKGIHLNYGPASLVITLFVVSIGYCQSPGSSPVSPAPVGMALKGIVECGRGYTSHELYDMKITLLQVLRGKEAWNRISKASSSNKPADAGFDYILAYIRFEYQARGTPGLCVHQLVPDQFTAFSSEGSEYRSVPIVPPQPEMRRDLKSGDAMEGWLVFMVAQHDTSPLMSYSADKGGAISHGGGKWFVLE
jgi:hypothetical protein